MKSPQASPIRHSSFGFPSSFVIRHSDFLCHSSFVIRHCLVSLAVAVTCILPRHAPAAESLSVLPSPSTNSSPHALTNRFLFIIETSKTMEPRSGNMLKIVEELLGTGMHGQLWAGDSVGVWTYDADVHTGRFPVQQFSTNMQRTITLRAMSFLNQHTYENVGKIARALALLDAVSRGSEYLTVVIINDGAEPILGTPFDKPINDSYKLWKKQQDDAKMPFVTVLQAESGKINHYSVNPAPWPVELPSLPAEFLAAKTAPPPPAPAPPPKQAPVYAAPIIIHGPKPSTPPAAQPADAAASTSAATNQPPPAAGAPATNAPSTAAATIPGATDISAQNTKPQPSLITNDQKPSGSAPLAVVDETKNNAAPNAAANPPPVIPVALAPPTLPTTPAPAATLAFTQPTPQPAPSESNSNSAVANPPAGSRSTGASPASDGPQTSVAAASPGSLPVLVSVGVGGLAVAAIGSALLLVRRARSTSRPSLITQSMEMQSQRHKS